MTEHDEQPTARWTRDRLDAYAAERGVDPAAYTTKDDLLAAIAAAAPAEDADDEADGDEGTADDAEPDEDGDDDGPVAAARYRVLKAITLADGRTLMPGEEFAPDKSFPARRPKQLVDQKFLRPID